MRAREKTTSCTYWAGTTREIRWVGLAGLSALAALAPLALGCGDGSNGATPASEAGTSPPDSHGGSVQDASVDSRASTGGNADGTSGSPEAGNGRASDAASEVGSVVDASAAPDASRTADAAGETSTDAARDASGADTGTGPRADSGTGDAGLAAITIWVAGDSTVQTYVAGNTEGNGGTELEGWGQELAPFFNTNVTVSNQAIGGRSVAFFMWAVERDAAGNYVCTDTTNGDPKFQLDANGNRIDTSQWSRIKTDMKPGDFVLIQFGTNDETHTCPRFVSLADFQTDFGLMADTVRAKGATPIFVTPMSHRTFTGTTVNNTLLPYADAMKTEAMQKSVQVADLNLRSVEYYEKVGNTFLATNIFDTGITHFIKPGAIEMASLVAGEIRTQGGPLAAYLK